MKDHKEDFRTKPTCRLINPAKSELGKISKNILEEINTKLRSTLGLNQWKSTKSVIEWFSNIDSKKNSAFIQLDIKDFYPSITEKILDNAMELAKEYTTISDDNIRIIKHCRKSLLFEKDTAWVKKGTAGNFDVTMRSYDGAEVCELVGIYILSALGQRIDKKDTGLYRDDGLIILRNCDGPTTDRIRKDIIRIFKQIGFKIEIKTNLKEVDFLDVTFDLRIETYRPYKKENDKLFYINTSSNHPRSIIKQIPTSISHRLSDNSANEKIFNNAKTEYENALKTSGHTADLEFNPNWPKKRNRKRNIIWFNPPFNKNIKTNIGKTFLKLIDKHFPRSSKLHKIFNRNTIKVSYSCTENMSMIIKKHNKKIINNKATPTTPQCNCRKKTECPLNGNCQQPSVIYQAMAKIKNKPEKVYLGLTEGPWKQRNYGHKFSFSNKKYAHSTALSKYVWDCKDKIKQTPEISWKIIKSAPAYTNTSKRCVLCLEEKIAIITYPDQEKLLNKR